MMKIHIIVFCHEAPNGEAPPPQWASMVVACVPSCISSSSGIPPPVRAFLECEEQKQEIEPESRQEVPIRGEQAEAVASRRIGQASDPGQHDAEPGESAQQMQ